MAYFSNGTEGMDYQARYCERCIHYPKGEDDPYCSIWNLHLLHNYDDASKEMLNELIPMSDKGFAQECSMFVFGGDREPVNMTDLYRDRSKLAAWVQAVQA